MKIPPIIKTFLLPLIFLFLFSVFGYFSFIKKPQNIEIVYDQTFNSLNPYTYSDFNNSPLNYMYETLIKYDQNLKLAPSLAVSYGRIDDLTIEFKLKKNVEFHSGQSLNSRAVKESFEVIKSESNLKDFLQNFKEIEVIDDLTFRILLEKNDPLVFSKLAIIPIAKFNSIQELESNPNGTGYYKFVSKNENQISLELNQNYHSNLPDFNNLEIISIPDFTDRINYANSNSDVVAVYGVSPEVVILNNNIYDLQSYSDQSTNFLIFNQNSKKLDGNKGIITQIFKSIDFNLLTSNLGQNTNQYLAKGVFGYNPNQKFQLLSLKDIKDNPALENLKKQELKLAIPKPFSKFSNFLIELFYTLDLNIQIELLEFNDYNKETLNNFDLIMFGFKSDFADGYSFFNSMARSDSSLNFGNFNNPELDQTLKNLESISEEKQRLSLIQNLSEQIQGFGIPLFENRIYYALSKEFSLTPRLDGLIDIKFLKAK